MGAVPPLKEKGAERDQVEVETHGHNYRNVGEEGAGTGKGESSRMAWRGRGGRRAPL